MCLIGQSTRARRRRGVFAGLIFGWWGRRRRGEFQVVVLPHCVTRSMGQEGRVEGCGGAQDTKRERELSELEASGDARSPWLENAGKRKKGEDDVVNWRRIRGSAGRAE